MSRPRRCPLHPVRCPKHDNPIRPRLNATPPHSRLGADQPARRGSYTALVAMAVPGQKQRRLVRRDQWEAGR